MATDHFVDWNNLEIQCERSIEELSQVQESIQTMKNKDEFDLHEATVLRATLAATLKRVEYLSRFGMGNI